MVKKNVICTSMFMMFALMCINGPAFAIYLDKAKTMSFSGKLQTRASITTEDFEGWTRVQKKVGELVQHRNLVYLQLDHRIDNIKPFGWDLKYHILGRGLYEGVYDYGPEKFRKLRSDSFVGVGGAPGKEVIDDFKYDIDVWEGYLDISKGPLFVRTGIQNLSWGETDVFRLSDLINPLDNTYGGIFEDLDDRRIPLAMIRASYNLGVIGPISSFALEGFLVPGIIEQKMAPTNPYYTVYNQPLNNGQLSLPVIKEPFSNDIANSRWGVRLQGYVGDTQIALSYIESFLDLPVLRFGHNLFAGEAPFVLLEWDKVQVASFNTNTYIAPLDFVLKTECAYFKDEPYYTESNNTPFVANPFFDPTQPIGGPNVPLVPVMGRTEHSDFFKFSIGIDRNQWIRFLNDKNMFMISLQYFGSYAIDHVDDMSTPLYEWGTEQYHPPFGRQPRIKEYEQTYTLLIMTTYYNGTINPQFVCAYDPRGAALIQPSCAYKFGPGRNYEFKLQYSVITGNFVGMGQLKDRDQVTGMLTYTF